MATHHFLEPAPPTGTWAVGDPDRRARRAVMLIVVTVGLLCLAACVVLGRSSVHVDGVRCGDGFDGVDNPAVLALPIIRGDIAELTPDVHYDCDQAVASPRAGTYLLLGAGSLVLMSDLGLFTCDRVRRSRS